MNQYQPTIDLLKKLQKPEPFAKSTAPFWDDPYISGQMLKAHLDPYKDLASRKHATIDRSVEWIVRELHLQKGNRILDLGCGPGLYCTRFAEREFIVTGIDYSKRSIQYAKEYATLNKLKIEYIYKDYLTIDYSNMFDLVTLIFCDFGVLSDRDRDSLLCKIHKSMNPGGHFLFDVCTPKYHDSVKEDRTWKYEEKGFWRPTPYLLLTEKIKYPKQDLLLTQYFVFDGNSNFDIYRIWDHAYTKDSISNALSDAGFNELQFYGDTMGREFSDGSETVSIVARKTT
ncbi:MAG: methyltransferase domain-containing protein [candidate division WOR-3 bacterium]|nr:MAG: methyltransferase domain-containing protein [candidate division WOR-3 bacterium]